MHRLPDASSCHGIQLSFLGLFTSLFLKGPLSALWAREGLHSFIIWITPLVAEFLAHVLQLRLAVASYVAEGHQAVATPRSHIHSRNSVFWRARFSTPFNAVLRVDSCHNWRLRVSSYLACMMLFLRIGALTQYSIRFHSASERTYSRWPCVLLHDCSSRHAAVSRKRHFAEFRSLLHEFDIKNKMTGVCGIFDSPTN